MIFHLNLNGLLDVGTIDYRKIFLYLQNLKKLKVEYAYSTLVVALTITATRGQRAAFKTRLVDNSYNVVKYFRPAVCPMTYDNTTQYV